MKVGVIGLGVMGRPMALHLQRAGHDLHVWARRPASVAGLPATVCQTPAELGRQCEVVFTIITSSADVEHVALGPDGLIEGMAPGSVLVDCSTIAPEAARHIAARLGEKGIAMLDAPVSGGAQGAIDATLAIMAGGEAEVLARVRPLLECLGQRIVHIGPDGAGQVAKACNQIVVAVTIEAVAEAMALARACGVDPAPVRGALLGGFAGSRVLDVHGQRIIDDNYAPGFKAKLHQKDMGIVADTAAALGIRLDAASHAAELIQQLVAQGDGELDSSAIARLIASRRA